MGFKPVAQKNARVLILGSLPGAESLRQRQYYAKKQNSFWSIMGEIAGALPSLPYEQRLAQLKKSRIALWDVCKSARRKGSLDADIRFPQPNDLALFLKEHKYIRAVFFNGRAAAALFHRHVKLNAERPISFCVLPSTSPAYAGMRPAEKAARWRCVRTSALGSRK